MNCLGMFNQYNKLICLAAWICYQLNIHETAALVMRHQILVFDLIISL